MTDGLDFVIGQSADLTARLNKKGWLVGTAAQILASTSGLEAGKHAHCTSAGSGLPLGDLVYDGTIWRPTGWMELGRVSPADAATSISLTPIAARKYLHVMAMLKGNAVGTTATIDIRFNNDATANYQWRQSLNGAADSISSGADDGIALAAALDDTDIAALEFKVLNTTANRKLVYAGSLLRDQSGLFVPERTEFVGLWGNTAAQITRIDLVITAGTTTFDATSELVVYGRD